MGVPLNIPAGNAMMGMEKVETSFEEQIMSKLDYLNKRLYNELGLFDTQLANLYSINYRLFHDEDGIPGICPQGERKKPEGFCAEVLYDLDVLADLLTQLNYKNDRLCGYISTLQCKLFMTEANAANNIQSIDSYTASSKS